MKQLLIASLALLALSTLTVAARAGHHHEEGCGCCTPPASPYVFNIEESEEKVCVTKREENKWTAKDETTTKEVPCTRCVAVTVKDCNGCCHTEMREETYLKKVKVTTLTVTPPAEPYTCKTEEKVLTHVRVSMSTIPTCGGCGK